MADETIDTNALELATELTIAWLGNQNTRVSAEDVPTFLQSMHATVTQLSGRGATEAPEQAPPEYTPATTARKSSPLRCGATWA